MKVAHGFAESGEQAMRASAYTKSQQRRMQPAPDVNTIRDAVAGLLLEATRFVAPARVEELARGWLPRASSWPLDPAREALQVTNSFQIGLGRGITAKLHRLREAREPALRTSTGRDLIVAKADV